MLGEYCKFQKIEEHGWSVTLVLFLWKIFTSMFNFSCTIQSQVTQIFIELFCFFNFVVYELMFFSPVFLIDFIILFTLTFTYVQLIHSIKTYYVCWRTNEIVRISIQKLPKSFRCSTKLLRVWKLSTEWARCKEYRLTTVFLAVNIQLERYFYRLDCPYDRCVCGKTEPSNRIWKPNCRSVWHPWNTADE
jgi:hypothetical protein